MSARSSVLRILALLLGAFLIAGSGMGGVAPTLAAGTGQIYIAEKSRVARVNDMTGAGLTTLGIPVTEVHRFSPEGIFVDGAGRIYVADSYNNRIVRVDDMTGAGWKTPGSRGNGVGQFNFPEPSGIFVDEAGRIYVADYGNSRIVRVNDMTGAGWTTLGFL